MMKRAVGYLRRDHPDVRKKIQARLARQAPPVPIVPVALQPSTTEKST